MNSQTSTAEMASQRNLKFGFEDSCLVPFHIRYRQSVWSSPGWDERAIWGHAP